MNSLLIDPKILHMVDDEIDKVVKSLNKESLDYLKEYCQKHFANIIDGNFELRLIVDANVIISELHPLIKKGKSFLLELAVSPFIKLFAPKWLKSEVDNKIPSLAKKWKEEEEVLRQKAKGLMDKITICDDVDFQAFALATTKIGHRDPKDVPYASLFFSLKTHGILSKDKDFTAAPEIRLWEKVGVAGKVVTVFEKGSLSFLIVGTGAPIILTLLFEIISSLFRVLWEAIQMMVVAISTFFSGVLGAIEKLPEWVRIALSLFFLFLLSRDKIRETIIDFLKDILQRLKEFAQKIYESLKRLLEILAPYVGIILSILVGLFQQMGLTIKTIKEIESGRYKPASPLTAT